MLRVINTACLCRRGAKPAPSLGLQPSAHVDADAGTTFVRCDHAGQSRIAAPSANLFAEPREFKKSASISTSGCQSPRTQQQLREYG